MFIRIRAGHGATLQEPDDFTAFKVVIHGGLADVLSEGDLTSLGRLDEDGAHLWINPLWLRSSGPSTDAWLAGLEAMLAYAERKGWRDQAGNVRAHIEFTS